MSPNEKAIDARCLSQTEMRRLRARVAARAASSDTAPRASWAHRVGWANFFSACVAACRPKSLTAAVVPFAVGTALRLRQAGDGGTLNWPTACPAFFGYVLMQIGCNLVNDACDFVKGADGPTRVGPARVTQRGVFRAKSVHRCGVVCLLAAFALLVPAGLGLDWNHQGGITSYNVNKPFLTWSLLSCAAAYLYTGGPYPLGYHGLGDCTVVAFFGVVATGLACAAHGDHHVSGGFYAQSPSSDSENSSRSLFTPPVLLAGTQTGCLAAVLLAVNNLRDAFTDSKVAKKTLAVVFGTDFVKREIYFLVATAYGLLVLWSVDFDGTSGNAASLGESCAWFNPTWASVLPSLTLPLALEVTNCVRKVFPGTTECNEILASAALAHLAFGVSLAAGLALDMGSVPSGGFSWFSVGGLGFGG
jgi:1,4-dihydroxy-2-naphthoate octaprenyltransferase